MHQIKHVVRYIGRMMLLVAAPRFAFSQVSEGQLRKSKVMINSTSHRAFPRGNWDPSPHRATSGPDYVITCRGTVYPWHCDHMGHMNVMWYTGKFDEASWQLLSSLGLTRARFRKDGIGMVSVEQHTEFKRELRAGDLITIRSAVLEVKGKSLRLRHEMSNDETGELAATTIIVGVHIDATLRKARPMPLDVRERAVAMIEQARGEVMAV